MTNIDTDNVIDTMRKLGFKIGSQVKIARRFFANHKLNPNEFSKLGIGSVEGKTLPDSKTLPALVIKFPYNKSFYECKELRDMLITTQVTDRHISILVAIHPVYVEKA